MPFFSMLDTNRVDFTEPISKAEIDHLVADAKIDVLQCYTPIKKATWDLLNNEFFRRRPEVELRVYGMVEQPYDLSFAAGMSHVHHFSADALLAATGIEAVTEMPNLERLGIGIYGLEDFNFLSRVSGNLTSLLLGATRSKKPDLSPLVRFEKLKRIYLEGQQKHIEVLGELNMLEDVTLRSITTPDMNYLSRLQRMWSLDIKLGGIRNFSGIEGMRSIKYLELWQVRELKDVDFIAGLPGLQNLMLQSLPRVSSLPSLREMSNLRRITVYNLKGLRDFSELQWSPALEEFVLIDGRSQQPEDFLPLLCNPGLRRAGAHFGSLRKEQRFTKLLQDHGIEEITGYRPFNYL